VAYYGFSFDFKVMTYVLYRNLNTQKQIILVDPSQSIPFKIDRSKKLIDLYKSITPPITEDKK